MTNLINYNNTEYNEEELGKIKEEVLKQREDNQKEVNKVVRTRGNKHKDFNQKMRNTMLGTTQYMYDIYLLPNEAEGRRKRNYYNFRRKYNIEDLSIKYLYEVEVSIREVPTYLNKYELNLKYVRYNLNNNHVSKLYLSDTYQLSKEEVNEINGKVNLFKVEERDNLFNRTKEIIYKGSLSEVNNFIIKGLGLVDEITTEDNTLFSEYEVEYVYNPKGYYRVAQEWVTSRYMKQWDGKGRVEDDLFDKVIDSFKETFYLNSHVSLGKLKRDLYSVIKLKKEQIYGKRYNLKVREEYRDRKDMPRSNVKQILNQTKNYDLEDIEEGILDNELVRVKTEEKGHIY